MIIAVLDDDRTLGEVMGLLARRSGAVTRVVSDQFASVLDPEFWRDVDVAVVDLLTGEKTTGLDVLRWLEQHAPHVRRVVCSGFSDVTRRLPEGLAHAVLSKPFRSEEFLEALGHVR